MTTRGQSIAFQLSFSPYVVGSVDRLRVGVDQCVNDLKISEQYSDVQRVATPLALPDDQSGVGVDQTRHSFGIAVPNECVQFVSAFLSDDKTSKVAC